MCFWIFIYIMCFFSNGNKAEDTSYVEGSNQNLGEALQFLREYDRQASGMCYRVYSAQWNYSTNITTTNRRQMNYCGVELNVVEQTLRKLLPTSFYMRLMKCLKKRCYSNLRIYANPGRLEHSNCLLEMFDGFRKILHNSSSKGRASCLVHNFVKKYPAEGEVDEQSIQGKFQRISWRKATTFAWSRLPDPAVRRQMRKLATEGRAALHDGQYEQMQSIITSMKDIYLRGKTCGYRSKALYCDLTLEPTLTRTLAQSRDYEEQLHIWKSWRDVVGPAIREKYVQYVHLANQAARLNGFYDAGEQMRSVYESSDFEDNLMQVWNAIEPLYRELHAYVRRRLVERYGSQRVRPNGPIPAHLLGNMWAQNWRNVEDLVLPFPGKTRGDITPELLRQGYNPLKMFQTAEEFFTSMGMKPMPPEFWRHSMIERPLDRDVVCRASAWDFCNHVDYRIKQCTEVTSEDFFTIHHEMAHIQYYLQYADQPFLFREGANPAFHEAVGDVVGLSVQTPKHLQRIGLLNNITDDYETNINFLISMALDKVVYLPFALIVDKWRWNTFAEGVKNMNSRWWSLRLAYQGLVPPVQRSERDFDPAAKYHIPADTPYIRYFVSIILQFQMYESLCEVAGHYGQLHTCDIYRSREAGRLLSEVLRLGSSKPWPEVISIMTRGKTSKLDAKPLLDYFEPLKLWLQVRNKGEDIIGWTTTPEDTALYEEWFRSRGGQHHGQMIWLLAVTGLAMYSL